MTIKPQLEGGRSRVTRVVKFEEGISLVQREDGLYAVGVCIPLGSYHTQQENIDFYLGPDLDIAEKVWAKYAAKGVKL